MEQSLIEDISHALTSAAEKGKVLYMASGGSSIPLSVEALRTVPEALRPQVTVTLTDERYGLVGHADSNWKQLQEHGLDTEGFGLLPVLTDESRDRDATTLRFEDDLRSALVHAGTVIALFGMGADHHIAGILPGSDAVRMSEHFVTAYDAGAYERITITPPVFPHIDRAFVYAKGEGKRESVESLTQDRSPIEHPNQLIKQCGTYAVMFVE